MDNTEEIAQSESQKSAIPIVSDLLPKMEMLESSIVACDPNSVDNPEICDVAIKDLYNQCSEILELIKGNNC